jgi:hypothetical protein
MSPDVPVATLTPDQLAAAEAAAAEARLASLLAMGDVNQANAATGIYGDTGTGKSVLLDTAAEYCYSRFRRMSRIISADLGGFGNKRLRLIRLGIVQVYNPLNHIEPFETMEDLSKGYWPEKITDPYTGFAAPDVKLIAPERMQWVVYCQQGHIVTTAASKAILAGFQRQCPTCKGAPVTAQNWGRVEEQIVRSAALKHIGLYGFDSGTSLADWAMEDMSDRAARTDPSIKDGNNLSNTGARVISGKYAFGANTQPHYGFAQNAVRRWIKNSRLIPRQVLPPIWTFLEDRGTDSDKNISVFGPKIPGTAKTHVVPSWLGNCLYATKELNAKQQDEHRLYLVNHTDRNSNVPHLAKTRAEPGTFGSPYLADVDPATATELPAFTRFSLGYFFDVLEKALDMTAKSDADAFPDAPAFQPLDLNAEDVEVTGSPVTIAPSGPQTARAMVTAPAARAAMAPGGVAPRPAMPTPVLAPPATATPAKPAASVAQAPTPVMTPAATQPVQGAPAATPALTTQAAARPFQAVPPGGRPPTPAAVPARPRVGAPPPGVPPGRKP